MEVVWHDVIAEVRIPSIPLLAIQRTAIEAELNRVGRVEDDAWFVMKKDWDEIAYPFFGQNIEECVEWRVDPKPRRKGGVFPDEFIESYSNSEFAILPDPLVNEVVWTSFLRFMLHRLVNERRPIDLFFCRLIPLMFRKNWKEIAIRKEYKRPNAFSHQPQQIIDRGMADWLVSDEMVAVDERVESNRCRWTLEVVESPAWHEATLGLENMRARLKGYTNRIIHQMRAQLPYAIDVYSAFLREASFPFVQFCGSDSSERQGVPLRGKADVGKRKRHTYSRERCVQLFAGETAPEPGTGPVPLEALLAMSAVRSDLPDMREISGGEMDEPEDGRGRDSGVSVSDESENLVSEQLLSLRGNERDGEAGLAKGTELLSDR